MPVTPADPASRGPIPYAIVERAAEAIDFYARAFGATVVNRMDAPDGKPIHAHLLLNGGGLMLSESRPEHGAPARGTGSITLQLVYDDGIDEAWNQALAAGCTATEPLQVMFWGDRWGAMTDPFGLNWAMNCPVKQD